MAAGTINNCVLRNAVGGASCCRNDLRSHKNPWECTSNLHRECNPGRCDACVISWVVSAIPRSVRPAYGRCGHGRLAQDNGSRWDISHCFGLVEGFCNRALTIWPGYPSLLFDAGSLSIGQFKLRHIRISLVFCSPHFMLQILLVML